MKTLTITNGKETIDIVCNKLISLKVSEDCLNQLTYKNKIVPEDVVLSVLLEEAKVESSDRINWSLII
jgi:hypothetical protein